MPLKLGCNKRRDAEHAKRRREFRLGIRTPNRVRPVASSPPRFAADFAVLSPNIVASREDFPGARAVPRPQRLACRETSGGSADCSAFHPLRPGTGRAPLWLWLRRAVSLRFSHGSATVRLKALGRRSSFRALDLRGRLPTRTPRRAGTPSWPSALICWRAFLLWHGGNVCVSGGGSSRARRVARPRSHSFFPRSCRVTHGAR